MHQATRVRRPAHSYLDELRPARAPIEPIVTSWKEALSILWQAGLLIVLFVAIAWTGPIFAAAVLR